jgi:outer membrane protein OmpA-like peptidoglycan-associated protein
MRSLLVLSVLATAAVACDEPAAAGIDTLPPPTATGGGAGAAPAGEARDTRSAPPASAAPSCAATGEGVSVTDAALVADGAIGFDLYGPELAPESKGTLDAVARRLVACSDIHVEVQVHTDTRRMESFNARASQAIGELVKAHLVGAGVPAERVAACGYGESRPLAGIEPWDPANDRVLFVRLAGEASAHVCQAPPVR